MERKYTAEDVKVWTQNTFDDTLTATFTDGRKETVKMSDTRRAWPSFAKAACINQANGRPDPVARSRQHLSVFDPDPLPVAPAVIEQGSFLRKIVAALTGKSPT